MHLQSNLASFCYDVRSLPRVFSDIGQLHFFFHICLRQHLSRTANIILKTGDSDGSEYLSMMSSDNYVMNFKIIVHAEIFTIFVLSS